MNARTVIAIAGAAALLAALAWWMNKPADNDAAGARAPLLPGLDGVINSLDKVRMENARGETVTLVPKDGTWRVTERAGYFADAGKVKALVLAASQATVLEEKTSSPDFYERLGVRDISAPESTAVLLEMASGPKEFAVLVGNSSPRAGGATLVRRTGDSTALLVAPAIDTDVDSAAWLDKRVLDIGIDDVQSVDIRRGNDRRIGISKDALFDDEFVMAGLDEGQTADSRKLDALARGLDGLNFDNVSRTVAFAIGDYDFYDVQYTLFDGVVIDAKVFYPKDADRENKRYWLAATARFDVNVARAFVPQPSSTTAGDESEQGDESQQAAVELTSADIADRRQKAEDINARTTGWIYAIPESRFKTFNQTPADLISE